MSAEIHYDADGRIVAVRTQPREAPKPGCLGKIAVAAEAALAGAETAELFYVDLTGTEPAVIERPTLDLSVPALASGEDWIPGLPAGARVAVDGDAYVMEGPADALAFAEAGTYAVEVEAFPFRRQVMTLEVG